MQLVQHALLLRSSVALMSGEIRAAGVQVAGLRAFKAGTFAQLAVTVSVFDYARESIHESIRAIHITPCE